MKVTKLTSESLLLQARELHHSISKASQPRTVSLSGWLPKIQVCLPISDVNLFAPIGPRDIETSGSKRRT